MHTLANRPSQLTPLVVRPRARNANLTQLGNLSASRFAVNSSSHFANLLDVMIPFQEKLYCRRQFNKRSQLEAILSSDAQLKTQQGGQHLVRFCWDQVKSRLKPRGWAYAGPIGIISLSDMTCEDFKKASHHYWSHFSCGYIRFPKSEIWPCSLCSCSLGKQSWSQGEEPCTGLNQEGWEQHTGFHEFFWHGRSVTSRASKDALIMSNQIGGTMVTL